MALQELRTKIYEIVHNDATPYKCRLYIQELDFAFCIGERKQSHNELVININDNCKRYHWLNTNTDKYWFTRWYEYYFKSSGSTQLSLENVK